MGATLELGPVLLLIAESSPFVQPGIILGFLKKLHQKA